MRKLLLMLLIAILLLPMSISLAAQNQPLTIGVVGSPSGGTLRGVRLALEQANAAGGIALPDGRRLGVSVVVAEARTEDEARAAIDSLRNFGVLAIFGPDDDAIAAPVLSGITTPGIPVFTSSTHNDVRLSANNFRTRANDTARMIALADVMISDLKAQRVAIYQGTGFHAPSPVGGLVVALSTRGISASPVLQDPNRPVADAASVLLSNQPDTIAAFGEPEAVAELYLALLTNNYAGRFVTDVADEREFINALGASPVNGILSAAHWALNDISPASQQFVSNYLRAFGEAPSSRAVAAYDTMTVLLDVFSRNGISPDQIVNGLKQRQPQQLVGATFDAALGNGETTTDVAILETNLTGGSRLYARYRSNSRLPNITEVAVQPTLVQPPVQPTLVQPPVVQPTTPPLVITATPDFVELTVTNDFVNIRSGPGTNYEPPLGRLPRNSRVRLLGANNNYTWFTFNFNGQLAWITSDPSLVSIFGNVRTLPVVPAPPTPTPIASPTPIGPQEPDIVVVSAFLSASPLKQNTPFSVTVTLRNQGVNNAGSFAVAASFQNVFGAVIVPGLGAGQQITVVINYPGVPNVGTFQDAVVVDLNKEVNEGVAGEANNIFAINYQVVP
ncbi:MAG: hypothetical protein OHK0023_09970 [Anaerolineae bacterium]